MEIIGVIAAFILLFWICSDKSSDNSGYKKGDLKISRDSNGEWYVYERKTGYEIYRSASKQDCADYVRSLV